MNWRNLHIESVIKLSRSRYQTKLNKVRKSKVNDKSEVKNKKSLMEIKYQTSEIPWDQICPDIYQQTVLSMEQYAIQDGDIDSGAHSCHSKLLQSLSGYVEGGQTNIQMRDIEKKYNQYSKNAEFYFSWLVVQRIKELKKLKKNKKSKRRKASGSSKKSPKKDLVDLTNSNTQRKKNSPSNSANPIINRMDMIKQNSNPIDLTKDDNNNTISTTISTTKNNSNRNSPSLTQNNRKRRRDEMSQSGHDESRQDYQSPIQPAKRRRVEQNNETNYNQLKQFPNNFGINSCVAIHEKKKDCYTLCIISSYTNTTMDVIEWETGASRRNINLNDCYAIKPYHDYHHHNKQIDNNNKAWVFALEYDQHGEFQPQYKLACIVENSDRLKIRYKHLSDGIKEVPPYTSIPSPALNNCKDNGCQIPTVIIQYPVTQYLRQTQSTQVTQSRQRMRRQHNNNNNNNNNMRVTHYSAPLSCHFVRELPNDPWNDQYFQGVQQS